MARAGLIALSFTFGFSATSASAEPPVLKADAPLALAVEAAPAAPASEAPAVAIAPKPVPPAITLHAKVDLTSQRVTILEHDKVKHSWPISSGARGHETPTGSFKPGWMAKTSSTSVALDLDGKAIAAAPDGFDVARVLGIGFDLAAQPANLVINRAVKWSSHTAPR